MTPVLELAGIGKRYGSVQALDGADFVLAPGEVHALLGENGAGKSTLMQVAFGLVEPDTGSIRIRGEAVRLAGPRDAKARGLGMVHQHFTSVPAMTVRENLWLAAGRVRHPAGSPLRRVRYRIDSMEPELDSGKGLDPSVRAEDLGVGAKQRLEILQALATGASVLLLDEPTGLLTQDETTELLQLLRAFADRGGAVVLITHKPGGTGGGRPRHRAAPRQDRVERNGRSPERNHAGRRDAWRWDRPVGATAGSRPRR